MIIDRYCRLKIVTIADIVRQSRFWIVKQYRMIQPLLCKITRSLGIYDHCWTLVLRITDDSMCSVECIVHNNVLVEFLGCTVNDCVRLRETNDLRALRQCQSRATEMERIVQRMDLVMLVEFPPLYSSAPSIVKISNLPSLLSTS
ncbi:hypothetical protein AB6A40_004952 [Gnathostoma spinigerum]|uniref:Uncharacterized protein n=1 Tax=Gnathostoma spinigerum TaxID=75299 RepID=A0ABD6EE59_9BILA